MSKTVQWKRGNANVSTAYIGAQGEITVDTSEWALRLHDGLTPGGFKISNDTDGNVDLGNIRITDQTIQGKNSNQDVNINASGNANVVLFGQSAVVSNDIYVQGNATVDGIIIQSNTVSTVYPTGNLILSSTLGNVITPTRFFANSIRLTNENFYIEQVFSNALGRNVVSFYSAINNAQDITIRANNNFLGYHASPLGTVGIRTFASNTVPVSIFGNTSIAGNLTSDSFITSNEYSSYSFAGNTGLRHRLFDANVNALTILHDNAEVARFLSNSLTQLTGNVVITGGAGIQNIADFPEGRLQVYSNVNTYSQIVHQNLSQGNTASSDYVATANNGDDTTFYVDLGIAGNLHTDPNFFGDTSTFNDAYLYVTGYDQAGPSLGNIGNLIIGSTNGIVKTFIGNTAEANVITIVDSTGLLPGANVVYSLGSATRQWKDLWVSNSTIYLGGVSLGVSADGNLLVNGNTVTGGTVAGNITVNLSAINFSANSSGDGNGYSTIQLIPDSTVAGNDQYIIVDPTAPGHIHIRAGGTQDNSYADLILGGENSNFKIAAGANAQAQISANSHSWTFGVDGTFTLPTDAGLNGSQINSISNSSGDLNGYTTLQLIPDVTLGTGSDQYLIIDPTAPGHIHIRSGGTQDNSNADLILGGEYSHVRIPAGANSTVYIKSNDYNWQFGSDGNLTIPGNINYGNGDSILANYATISSTLNTNTTSQSTNDFVGGNYYNADTLSVEYTAYTGASTLNFNLGYQKPLDGNIGINVAAISTPLIQSHGNIVMTSNVGGVESSWSFGTDGSLSTPGNVIVNDTLFISGSIQPIGASPAPSLSGFSSISTVISGNPNEGNITAHNYLIANGGIITSGNITANYLIGNGSELTSVNAATVDILNTNGLGTTFYPTFVENRTDGQILRADVDLSYRTDTNTLTTNAISSSGNISASYFIGNGALLTGISGGTGNYGNSNVSAFLASFGNNAIVTTGNITAGNLIGNVSITGNITGTSTNVELVAGSNTWTFNNTGNLVLPGNTFGVYYANGTVVSLGGAGNYDNTNVTALLGSLGSNTIVTSGNVTVGNLITGNGINGYIYLGNANSRLTQIGSNSYATFDQNIIFSPDTNKSALAGIVIGGNGYLLGPNGARNITLNYGSSGVVGLQANVTVGSSGSGTLTVVGTATTGINAILAGPAFTPLANTSAGFVSSVNSYSQITFQNKSTGADATADYILTADNGSDTVNYGDFGIINSGYDNATPTNSLGNIVYAADTYLYAQGNVGNVSQSGGNLAIGTTVAGKTVKIFAGGANASSVIATVSNTGVAVTGSMSVSGNITGTTPNVNLIAGSYTHTFDNTGNVTIAGSGIRMPSRPAMRVYGNTSTYFGVGTTITGAYFLVDYNQASALNASTGIFTAPVAGLYSVTLVARVGNNNGLNQVAVLKNDSSSGANVICFWETDTSSNTAVHFGTSGVANLAAGDTLRTKVLAGNIQFDSNDSWTVTYIG